jgi:hypothetical protein
VAVTVLESPSVVLDAEYRIVELNAAARPWAEAHVGKVVFDCYPGSESLFRPHYERARATGETVAFSQFYGGTVFHLIATPHGSDLVVTWTSDEWLDTSTLESLYASLDAAIADLAGRARAVENRRARSSLHLVEGDG